MSLTLPCRIPVVSQKSDLYLTNGGVETEDLAERPCLGNRRALPEGSGTLERLIQKHRPLIKKLCAGYARQREDAEDLEAMTLLTACRRFESYDPGRGAFGTWLGAILRNEAADMRRRAARQVVTVPLDDDGAFAVEDHVAAIATEQFPETRGLAEFELTPLLRRAFELVKQEGMTCAEAGQVMGKTEGTVRTYVWKARQIMRGALM